MNKLDAVRAYEKGDFSANAEHPMVMKALMYLSLHDLTTFGRTDLESRAISAQDYNPANATGPTYVIVQRGRTYFENRDEIAFVRGTFKKTYEVTIEGATAAEVFVKE